VVLEQQEADKIPERTDRFCHKAKPGNNNQSLSRKAGINYQEGGKSILDFFKKNIEPTDNTLNSRKKKNQPRTQCSEILKK
jgi:hypothetical protein